MNPSVTVIIVNYNGIDFVSTSIATALSQEYEGRVEVIVVDNASTDGSLELLRSIEGIRLIENPMNLGFGGGANTGLSATTTDYFALLNPDASADRKWLARMVPWMVRTKLSFASSLISAGTELWFGGGRFVDTIGATLVSTKKTLEADWLSGCALMGTRSAIEVVGGFDDGFFLYYEDVDLCLRARSAGLSLGILPEYLVDHPSDGRSTNQLGSRKAEIGYFSRGRLIGKHVRGWKLVPAMTFTMLVSPVRNRVPVSSIVPVLREIFRGFRSARRNKVKTSVRSITRPRIGVLLNIYEHGQGIKVGGHRHFIEVIRRWEHAQLVLFGPSTAKEAALAELPDAEYVVLPSLDGASVGKAIDFLFRSVAWIGAFPRLRGCDVMLATSHFLPDVVPAIFSGRPTVVIVHHLINASGSALRGSFVPQISERVSLLLIRSRARAVLALSDLVATELRRRSFRMPIEITSNGVDHLSLHPTDRTNAGSMNALFVGRLHPAKGALDAVRAWRKVVDVEPHAHLTIIGAREVGTYATEIETFIQTSHLQNNVTIRSNATDDEKHEAMIEAQAFIFPSYEEGWGIAVAEAMRAGLPCVTYALPIFAEIFPKGRLEAAIGDTDGLARGILSVFGDAALRMRLSDEALELASRFSWSRASTIECNVVSAFFA